MKHGGFLFGSVVTALSVVVGACTGGSEGGSQALGTARTTTTAQAAGVETSTSTTVGSTSTVPAAATTTLPRPVYVDGIPQVRVTPTRASVGTRVRIEGTGFTDQQWKPPGGTLWLSAIEAPCALVAETDATVTVTADGRLTGSFVVPPFGACRQSDVLEMRLVGGRYYLNFQCTVCRIGVLEIDAPPAPASLRCNDIPFAPNSDNLASDIVATGVSCAEAEALVRKVGGPLGPVNGAPRAEADGWVCVRTGETSRGLPTATYQCSSGSRTITFVR